MKKGDSVQPGDFPHKAELYSVDETAQSETGAPTRPRTLLYTLYTSVDPYLGLEAETSMREAEQVWVTIGTRYFATRIAKAGQVIKILMTGEEYEVRGVLPGFDRRRVIRYTCRKLE